MGRPKLTRYQLAARRAMGMEILAARQRALLSQAALAEEIVRAAAARGSTLQLSRHQISEAERGAASAPPALRAWLAEQTD